MSDKQRTKAVTASLQPLALEGTEPPGEFLIWPFGEVRTTKGDFIFDEYSGYQVMANWLEHGADLSFDYGHAAIEHGEAPAAAWFRPELRSDGLWATEIEWSPKARAHLVDREYRYYSPWFDYDEETRQILVLHNIALTNTPATSNLQPLVASRSKEERMDPNKTSVTLASIAVALGVNQDTAAPQVAAEALALRSFNSELLSVTGAADRDSALGVITAWRDGSAQSEALSARVEELEAEREAAERDALIEQALTDRKLTPAQAAEGAFARTAPIATLKAYLSTAPRVTAAAVKQPAGNSEALSWADMDGPERAALYQSNPDLYNELRTAARSR